MNVSPKTSPESRFWDKVNKSGPVAYDGLRCWLWTRATAAGYGVIGITRERMISTHRLSLEMALGRPIGRGLLALHRCDVKLCVRPEHLYEGTHRDNVRDAHARGRGFVPKPMPGSTNPNAKLAEADIRAIRTSQEKNIDLARRYGVSGPLISYIRSRKAWASVP